MASTGTYYASNGKTVSILVSFYESSMIRSIEWNNSKVAYGFAEDGELVVRFTSGTTYVYENVRLEVLWTLAHSESVGKAFNENVKGKYEFRKLELATVSA